MMDWQPIETAPKDTDILGCVPEADDFYGPIRILRSDEKEDRWWHYAGDDTTGVNPTHWMPLPAPPVCNASAEVLQESVAGNDEKERA